MAKLLLSCLLGIWSCTVKLERMLVHIPYVQATQNISNKYFLQYSQSTEIYQCHSVTFSCSCTLQYFFLNQETALSFTFHVLCWMMLFDKYMCNKFYLLFILPVVILQDTYQLITLLLLPYKVNNCPKL
jgi:hypothetical protein